MYKRSPLSWDFICTWLPHGAPTLAKDLSFLSQKKTKSTKQRSQCFDRNVSFQIRWNFSNFGSIPTTLDWELVSTGLQVGNVSAGLVESRTTDPPSPASHNPPAGSFLMIFEEKNFYRLHGSLACEGHIVHIVCTSLSPVQIAVPFPCVSTFLATFKCRGCPDSPSLPSLQS